MQLAIAQTHTNFVKSIKQRQSLESLQLTSELPRSGKWRKTLVSRKTAGLASDPPTRALDHAIKPARDLGSIGQIDRLNALDGRSVGS
jgi:hypothetical protein